VAALVDDTDAATIATAQAATNKRAIRPRAMAGAAEGRRIPMAQ
jgi:hypothetical protein